jgi:hypothetical protein
MAQLHSAPKGAGRMRTPKAINMLLLRSKNLDQPVVGYVLKLNGDSSIPRKEFSDRGINFPIPNRDSQVLDSKAISNSAR